MTFHLEGPWLSSISTRKRAEKITKAQRDELDRNWRDRNRRLKEIGLPKQTFEEFLDFVHGRKEEKASAGQFRATRPTQPTPNQKRKVAYADKSGIPTLAYRTQTKRVDNDNMDTGAQTVSVPLEITRPDVWIKGPTSSKPAPTYTGTKVIGIGTMHKSNMVPIFNDEEAVDISKMRR